MKENEKQAIEEMARDLCACYVDHTSTFDPKATAEKMTAKGYRKQIEGEWIVDGGDLNRRATCPNCKHEYAVQKGMLQLQNFSFCPDCGAHMKGGAEE